MGNDPEGDHPGNSESATEFAELDSSLKDEDLAVSWLLGGDLGGNWKLDGYFPDRPSKADLDGEAPVTSSKGTKKGPHLLRVGSFLRKIAPFRRRILGQPSVALSGGSQAPDDAPGRGPNG